MDKRIKRLEGEVLWRRPPSDEALESARRKVREAIERVERRCEEDKDPTNRRGALDEVKRRLRERGGC